MDPGAILSHVTVIEIARYPKLIVCGDVAVLPAPELKEKIAITRYQIAVAHALGIELPKVAIIAATEQMLYKMPACVDAAIIAKMADRGDIKGALVDGPLLGHDADHERGEALGFGEVDAAGLGSDEQCFDGSKWCEPVAVTDHERLREREPDGVGGQREILGTHR